MNAKTLAILASVAAALAVIAAVVSRKDRPVAGPTPGAEARLFEGLGAKLDSVAAVALKHGDQELTLRKAGAGWEIAEKGGYPAKTDQVRAVLVGMAELREAEKRTSRPDLYSKLNVQDPDGKPIDAGAAGPTLLTLKDDRGGTVAAAIVGTSEPGTKPAVNIRKVGDAQTWLATGTLDVPVEATRWVDTKILEMPQDRIKGVTVTQPEGATLVLSRNSPQDQAFVVADVPTGDELKSPTAGNAVAQALQFLNFEDVAPADQVDFKGESGGKPGVYCEFRTFDGVVIAAQLAEAGGKTWARFTANFEETAAPPAPEKPGDPDPAIARKEAAMKEVADLNNRLATWAFVIPGYKATVLNTKMADLLKSTPPTPPPSMEGTIPLTPPPGGG